MAWEPWRIHVFEGNTTKIELELKFVRLLHERCFEGVRALMLGQSWILFESLIPLMLEQSWRLWAPFLWLDLRIEATKVQLSVPYFHIRGGASSKAREPSQCPQDPSGSSRFTISVTFLLCPPPTINSTTKIIKKICDNWEGGHIIFYCIPHN